MKPLFHGWRYAAVCALLLGLPVAAACSSEPPLGSAGNEVNDAEMEILFPKMYSAFVADGDQEFRVPAMVVGVKKVKWSAEPADAVSLEKQADGSVIITTKKAGDVTIIAKAGNLKATAPLKITSATAEEWKEGDERYNNGVVWKRGEKGDGGGVGKGERKVDPTLSCTNCHNKGGKGGDVEHTPLQTAGFTDDELVKIFSEGQKPAGVKMRTGQSRERWSKMHQWSMGPEEKKGIVTYLRSLEPEAQGDVDWGGRGPGGGKGKRDEGKDDGNGTRDSGSGSGPQ